LEKFNLKEEDITDDIIKKQEEDLARMERIKVVQNLYYFTSSMKDDKIN